MADSNSTQQTFSPLVLIMLLISAIGMFWLAANEIQAGLTHIILFLVSTAFITLSFLFINEEAKDAILRVIQLPFKVSIHTSALAYMVGFVIPIVLFMAFRFDTSQFFVPLSAETINLQLTQSFSAVQVTLNEFWRWFVMVFTAGTNEEFAFGFVAIIMGAIIGDFILQATKIKKQVSNLDLWYLIFGIAFSIILFLGIHYLNGSYFDQFGIPIVSMFVVSAIFRLSLNLGIYYLGLALSFAMGLHHSNNAIWFFNKFGADATASALTSTGGLIIIILYIFILLTAIIGFKDAIKEGLFKIGLNRK